MSSYEERWLSYDKHTSSSIIFSSTAPYGPLEDFATHYG